MAHGEPAQEGGGPDPIPGDGYGAVAPRQHMVTGRRAAVCIGALLAVCVFLVLSTDSAQQLPAVLFGGDWSGSFTTPLAGPASSSIDDAKVELDKEMVSKVGEDPSIGKGVGISGRWSSAFASEPALPSTGATYQFVQPARPCCTLAIFCSSRDYVLVRR